MLRPRFGGVSTLADAWFGGGLGFGLRDLRGFFGHGFAVAMVWSGLAVVWGGLAAVWGGLAAVRDSARAPNNTEVWEQRVP